jgi:hypothetical protein
MDKKVMDELMNKGIVTHVGLDASKIDSVDELMNLGLATSTDTIEVYNDIVESNDIVVDEGPTLDGGTINGEEDEDGGIILGGESMEEE